MPPIELTHYAELDRGSIWLEPSWATGNWFWMPEKWIHYPHTMQAIEMFYSLGWEDVGTVAVTGMALYVLMSQLVDTRLTVAGDERVQERHLWIPTADRERIEMLPVMLTFIAPPDYQKQAERSDVVNQIIHPRPIPPPQLGEKALILVKEGEQIRPVQWKIKRLPEESQQLQRRMGAALSHLASARNLAPLAWIEQWEGIQTMARDLARAYWRAHQNAQVKPPAPINIWTVEREGTFAAMTMVQEGAQAGIYHKDEWEQKHMIQSGKQQGIDAPRYIHATKEHKTETEYWMQFPDEDDVPADPDLISQEMLKQQAKLSDEMADLVMLAPIYLLARGEDEAYISPEQLLRDMARVPTHNQAGYGNDYRPEERQRVIDEFDRLAWIHLKTRQWIQKRRGARPAVVTAEAPYILVTERIWQEPLEEGGPRKFLGWKYQIGWLKAFTSDGDAGRQLGILLKKSFVYSQNQRWEKRLARYLTIHLGIAAHKGGAGIDCKIGHVLEQCGLSPSERDRARPGEYANRFEAAMDHLKRDGIVGDWLPRLDRNAPDFPSRDWLSLWLDSSFHVTHPPFALAHGYQKMIDNANTRREKAAAKEATPRQKQAPK